MSQVINMLDAKTSLSKLVQALESGTESEFIRRIGVAKGRFAVPDDIDRSNPEVRDLFEGS